ncbi:hypothetical protein AB838_06255 [Rhodobacteraceae bacterium (ex Bugula neritina AB1)]|nr:hypothetical protein AB838_06255 [Rhodobacteraceae bacterium (ex Bugula neritina AB1)]
MFMKICIINTGGTISCVGDPLAPMSAADFAAASQTILDPILAEEFSDTTLVYETDLVFPESSTGTLDSTNLQPSDWCLMAGYILDNYADYDGFVILHGTDSMDFTGSALPFLLNVFDAQGFGTALLSKPVIITGSQVPMFAETTPGDTSDLTLNFNTDAFQNFCGAVACARLGIPEVGVYFDSCLYRGDRVLKVNASEFVAFNSPNYPPLAQYGIRLTQYPDRMLPDPVSSSVSLDNATALATAQAQLSTITDAIDDFPVMQFNAFPAVYSTTSGTAIIANLITAMVGTGLKGLVLESYGEGNFPSGNPDNASEGGIYTALKTANDAGVVIVDSTQVIAGTVNDSAYASGAWLPDVGALSASDMTPMAAFAKTMILQAAAAGNSWTADQVKDLIQLNLFGEVQNVSRLDSRSNSQLLAGQSIMALDGSATLSNDPVSGPVLSASDGTFLWAPFGSQAAGHPGSLFMQNDGNLVLRSADNEPIWATDTGVSGGASSMLMISGSYGSGDLALSVYNYSGQTLSATLYSQN